MKLEHRLSALLQLHLHFWLNTWFQWIGQRQLQDKTRVIQVLGFGVAYIISNSHHWSCINMISLSVDELSNRLESHESRWSNLTKMLLEIYDTYALKRQSGYFMLWTAMDSIMKLKISQITVILRWQWLIFWQHNPQQNHDEMIVDDPEKMLMNSL